MSDGGDSGDSSDPGGGGGGGGGGGYGGYGGYGGSDSYTDTAEADREAARESARGEALGGLGGGGGTDGTTGTTEGTGATLGGDARDTANYDSGTGGYDAEGNAPNASDRTSVTTDDRVDAEGNPVGTPGERTSNITDDRVDAEGNPMHPGATSGAISSQDIATENQSPSLDAAGPADVAVAEQSPSLGGAGQPDPGTEPTRDTSQDKFSTANDPGAREQDFGAGQVGATTNEASVGPAANVTETGALSTNAVDSLNQSPGLGTAPATGTVVGAGNLASALSGDTPVSQALGAASSQGYGVGETGPVPLTEAEKARAAGGVGETGPVAVAGQGGPSGLGNLTAPQGQDNPALGPPAPADKAMVGFQLDNQRGFSDELGTMPGPGVFGATPGGTNPYAGQGGMIGPEGFFEGAPPGFNPGQGPYGEPSPAHIPDSDPTPEYNPTGVPQDLTQDENITTPQLAAIGDPNLPDFLDKPPTPLSNPQSLTTRFPTGAPGSGTISAPIEGDPFNDMNLRQQPGGPDNPGQPPGWTGTVPMIRDPGAFGKEFVTANDPSFLETEGFNDVTVTPSFKLADANKDVAFGPLQGDASLPGVEQFSAGKPVQPTAEKQQPAGVIPGAETPLDTNPPDPAPAPAPAPAPVPNVKVASGGFNEIDAAAPPAPAPGPTPDAKPAPGPAPAAEPGSVAEPAPSSTSFGPDVAKALNDADGGGGGGGNAPPAGRDIPLASQLLQPIPGGPVETPQTPQTPYPGFLNPGLGDQGSPAGNYNPEAGVYAPQGRPGGPVPLDPSIYAALNNA